MRRRIAALAVAGVLFATGCAVGEPKSPTYVSGTGATLNANVYSSADGPTNYWFTYGPEGDIASWEQTPHRTLAITDRDPHPVSEPIDGLSPGTEYGWQVCVADQQETPPRTVCSKRQSLDSPADEGARSGIAFGSFRDGNGEIYAMDSEGGNQANLTSDPAQDSSPDWSPNGAKMVFSSNRDGNYEIYVMDADGSNPTRLTDNTVLDDSPSWSPDGSKIAFTSTADGLPEIYVMDADGTNPTRLTDSSGFNAVPAWSPDGTHILFSSSRDGNFEIYVMDAGGTNPTRLTTNASPDQNGSWSPDGETIAFESNRDGNHEIYVMDADGANQTRLTTNSANDGSPSWSPRPPVPPLPMVYIAMGDSVTQVGDAQRYPERFFSFLQQDGAADVLHNIGENGQTSGGLNGSQLTQAKAYIDDPATNATVVSIDIGGNDVLGGQGCHPQGGAGFNLTTCQSTLNQFSTNFAATLNSLNQSLAGDPGTEQLLVMGYYNPWSGRSGQPSADNNGRLIMLGADLTLDCDGTGEDLGLNDRISCIGADHNAKFANAYPPFIGHGLDDGSAGDYMFDNIHPNGAGHQAIADVFEAAFQAP